MGGNASEAADGEGQDSVDSGGGRGKAESAAWSRDGFYLRLTASRRELLRSMAAGVIGGASPVAAVDRALGLASIQLGVVPEKGCGAGPRARPDATGADDGDGGLDDDAPHAIAMEAIESLGAMSNEWRAEQSALSGEMRQLGASVDALRRLIADAAGDGPEAEAVAAEPPSVERWFASEFARLGLRVGKVAIARARWLACMRSGESAIRAEFALELAGADGKPLPKGAKGESSATLDGLAPGGALAFAGMEPFFFFAAQPLAQGRWAVSAYRRAPDGSLGEKLG